MGSWWTTITPAKLMETPCTFQASVALNAGNGPILVGDFNQDGRPDLVTTDHYGNQVLVLLGMSGPPSTSITLQTSPDPSIYGQTVMLTASVIPSNATGKVQFLDGTAVLRNRDCRGIRTGATKHRPPLAGPALVEGHLRRCARSLAAQPIQCGEPDCVSHACNQVLRPSNLRRRECSPRSHHGGF
jgi:hypothetical protein